LLRAAGDLLHGAAQLLCGGGCFRQTARQFFRRRRDAFDQSFLMDFGAGFPGWPGSCDGLRGGQPGRELCRAGCDFRGLDKGHVAPREGVVKLDETAFRRGCRAPAANILNPKVKSASLQDETPGSDPNTRHESILTTFSSYGPVTAYRQAEIMRRIPTSGAEGAKPEEILSQIVALASRTKG
jgi:hypothetical protein